MAEEDRLEELHERQRAKLALQREERKKRAPRRTVSGSVLDRNVLRIKGYAGTLDLMLAREVTAAWKQAECDTRASMVFL